MKNNALYFERKKKLRKKAFIQQNTGNTTQQTIYQYFYLFHTLSSYKWASADYMLKIFAICTDSTKIIE